MLTPGRNLLTSFTVAPDTYHVVVLHDADNTWNCLLQLIKGPYDVGSPNIVWYAHKWLSDARMGTELKDPKPAIQEQMNELNTVLNLTFGGGGPVAVPTDWYEKVEYWYRKIEATYYQVGGPPQVRFMT